MASNPANPIPSATHEFLSTSDFTPQTNSQIQQGLPMQEQPSPLQKTKWAPGFQVGAGGNAGQASSQSDIGVMGGGMDCVDLDLQLASLPYRPQQIHQWPPLQQTSQSSQRQQQQQLNVGSSQQSALMGGQVSGHVPMLPGEVQSNQCSLLPPMFSQATQKKNLVQRPQSAFVNYAGQTLQGMHTVGAMDSHSPNSQFGANGSSYAQQAVNNIRQQLWPQQNPLDSNQAQGLPFSSSMASTLTQNEQPSITETRMNQQLLLKKMQQLNMPFGYPYYNLQQQTTQQLTFLYQQLQSQLQQLQTQVQLLEQLVLQQRQQQEYIVLQQQQQLTRRSGTAVQKSSSSTESQIETPASDTKNPTTTPLETSTHGTKEDEKGLVNKQTQDMLPQHQLTRRSGTVIQKSSSWIGSQPGTPASDAMSPTETSTHGTKENKNGLSNQKKTTPSQACGLEFGIFDIYFMFIFGFTILGLIYVASFFPS